jgi:hypothetical protein
MRFLLITLFIFTGFVAPQAASASLRVPATSSKITIVKSITKNPLKECRIEKHVPTSQRIQHELYPAFIYYQKNIAGAFFTALAPWYEQIAQAPLFICPKHHFW